jgi:hypothetical protein
LQGGVPGGAKLQSLQVLGPRVRAAENTDTEHRDEYQQTSDSETRDE